MEFKTRPFHHQEEELGRSGEERSWGYFWEQGTGKSKLVIDLACSLWERREIDAVVVVAPNGVHRNWVESEIPAHMPDRVLAETRVHCYHSAKADTVKHRRSLEQVTRHEGFSWLTISYDAFVTKAGKKALTEFFSRRKFLYVLDEAQAIKNPAAERTRSILRSAKFGSYRRVLTGTPIGQGPFDLYPIMKFLEEDFWAKHQIGSYTEFRHHFGEFERAWNPAAFNPVTKRMGREYEVLKSYRRLDELAAIIRSRSSRVTKDEVLDLPPKLYTKRYFTMTGEQERHYRELREEFITWLAMHPEEAQAQDSMVCPVCRGQGEREVDGMIYSCEACEGSPRGLLLDVAVAAPQAMVRLLRLQQVTCGYLPTDDSSEPVYSIPGPNRRLEEALDLCEEAQHKVIVWARFQMDITLLLQGLRERGISAVRYDGMVGEDDRATAVARFTGTRPVYQKGSVVGREPVPEEEQAKVFVGNPAAGATGLTLVQAKTVIYYSNSFKLLDRLQSEDRAHRIGQTNQVLYVDLVAESSVDDKIVTALRTKRSLADLVLGDKEKEWI